MRPTIRLKLLLSSSLLLLVIFGGMTVYLVRQNTSTLRTNLQHEARAFAALATGPVGDSYNVYADSGTEHIQAAMGTYLNLNQDITDITVVDLTGTSLYSYNANLQPKVTETQASNFSPQFVTSGGTLQYVVYPYFSASGGHPYSIVYTVSNQAVNAAVHHEELSLLLFGVLLLLLTSVLTYILLNRIIVKPIRNVSRQAAIISGGNLEQQIVVHGHDEIASLGVAVNTMAESLKANIAQLQEVDKVKSEFMAITSHNLRTPLTIINGYLEVMDSVTSVDKLKEALKRIGDSVKRLGSFAEDVLTISSIELGEESQLSPIAIGDFMQRIVDQTRISTQLQKLALTTDIRTNITINVNAPYLRSAVWNLIDNALKFTPENGSIDIGVDLTPDGKQVRIAVTDTGIGIAADEIPKLFTKFHRATSVIKYDYEGTGIGLYATKIIVQQQGGTIAVKSQEGKGSMFTIILPVAEEAHPGDNSGNKP